MYRVKSLLLSCAAMLFVVSGASGDITSVTESGLGNDAPAIIVNNGFGEDALTFSDRTHEHNGAAFDANTDLLSVTGSNVVPLPAYLVGGDYVRFANNARDQRPYEATVTADVPMNWFLLVDNRVDGPAGNNNSPNTTDAVLGGTLQWIVDGGWLRVNTGISPGGQADYTAVDEGGNAVGPGLGLNQFYSVWTLPEAALSTSVTVSNNGIGGNNMISLVGTEANVIPEPATLSLIGLASVALIRRRRVA